MHHVVKISKICCHLAEKSIPRYQQQQLQSATTFSSFSFFPHLGKGAEDLRGHLQAPLLLAVVHKLGTHSGVGLGEDGLVEAMALAAQLGSKGHGRGYILLMESHTAPNCVYIYTEDVDDVDTSSFLLLLA